MKQYTLITIPRLEIPLSPSQVETNHNLWSLTYLVEWSPEELDRITNLEAGQQVVFSDFAVRRTQ